MRGIWNHSLLDALTIGDNTIALARNTYPDIQPWKPYDGQFFYAMTFDPLLISKESVQFIDAPLYRYRRMLYPLLAHIFAIGNPKMFPYSLFFVNFAAWLSIGAALWLIAEKENLPKFLLVFGGLFTTGLTYSTFRTLSETLAMALALWGCYTVKRGRIISSVILFAFAGLARETSVTVPATVFLYIFFMKPKNWLKIIFCACIAALPAVLWWLYVSARLPEANFPNVQYLTFPFLGIFRELWIGMQVATSLMEHKRTLTIVIITVLLIIYISLAFWKNRTFWGALALGQAFFCSIVQGGIWNYHAGAVRVVVPLTIFSTIWFIELAYSENQTVKCP